MSSTKTTETTDTAKRHLGVVSYKASPTKEPEKGDIISSTSGKNYTKLRHNGNEWANALVWIEKQFENSGKSCSIRVIPLEQAHQTPSTPRPMYRSYSYKTGFT
jgi:hypothetical protein